MEVIALIMAAFAALLAVERKSEDARPPAINGGAPPLPPPPPRPWSRSYLARRCAVVIGAAGKESDAYVPWVGRWVNRDVEVHIRDENGKILTGYNKTPWAIQEFDCYMSLDNGELVRGDGEVINDLETFLYECMAEALHEYTFWTYEYVDPLYGP
tara:strand:- start:10 stop:477 length:468 start_codon:yes stop_codon:yes gene_type:complete